MNASLGRTALALGICLIVAAPASAQKGGKKAKGKNRRNDVAATTMQAVFGFPAGIELSAEQTKKVDALRSELGPKLETAAKKADPAAVLTPDQVAKRREAQQVARSEGKKGKDLRAAVEASVTMTDEQIKKHDAAKTDLRKLTEQCREKVLAVLSDEQRAKVKDAEGGKKKKKKDKENG